MIPHAIYTDGGVIGPNPSELGGTWAYCWVNKNDKRIHTASGIVTPEMVGVDKITNNLTELWAAMEALQSLPEMWRGTIYTDSKITLHRITNSKSFKGIPNTMRLKIFDLRRDHKYKVVLIGGHPTKKQLIAGISKRGYPVSKHNVWCDERCNRLAWKFKNQQC